MKAKKKKRPIKSTPRSAADEKHFDPTADAILAKARTRAKAHLESLSPAEKFDEVYEMFRKED